MKNHAYTYEVIFHFNCGEGNNWWSYATSWEFKENWAWKNPEMSCPHCGHKSKIEPKEFDNPVAI